MMKKNPRHQEENNDNLIEKSAENKENTANNDNSGLPVTEDISQGGTAGTATEGAGKAVDSDKLISNGRALEEKLAEMQDKYIRLSAEFDNYRKRTLREKMDLSKYAGEGIFLGVIPIIDDFERALSHIDASTDMSALKDGIDLIYGKFTDFLKMNGVKEIESMNVSFNVDIHEAVAKIPVEDADKKGKVIDVVQKGYYLQDKVLRFAKVVVGE